VQTKDWAEEISNEDLDKKLTQEIDPNVIVCCDTCLFRGNPCFIPEAIKNYAKLNAFGKKATYPFCTARWFCCYYKNK
jgi:hypothetical protein